MCTMCVPVRSIDVRIFFAMNHFFGDILQQIGSDKVWHHVRSIESICSLPIILGFIVWHQNILIPNRIPQRMYMDIFEPRLTSNLYKYPKLSHYSQMVSHCMVQENGMAPIGLWRTQAHIHTHTLTFWWSTKQIMFACTFSTHQTFRYSFTKCYFRW